jgi:hypothetical protein
MRGTVEGHVLGEVRQALLVFVFEDGAGLHHQPQLQLFLRAAVLLDVVSQAIGNLPTLTCGPTGILSLSFKSSASAGKVQARSTAPHRVRRLINFVSGCLNFRE